jgi:hypothetical protein
MAWGTYGLALFCALLISSCNLVSEIFRDFDHFQEFLQSGLAFRYCLRAFAVAAIVFALCVVLFRLWDATGNRRGSSPVRAGVIGRFLSWRMTLTDRQLFAVGALVLVVPWMVWAIAHFPGALRDDTFAQLFQYYGVHRYYSQHPVLATLVFGFFWDFGALLGNPAIGLFALIVIQIVLTACVISASTVFAMRQGMPHAIAVALIVFMALGRAFYQPVDTMSKDALNGWLFVLSLLCFARITETKGSWLLESRWNAPVSTLAMTFCFATKRTMVYAFFGAVLIIAVVCLFSRRRRPSKKALCAAALVLLAPFALCFGLIQPVLDASLQVAHNATYEMYSIPEQQVVRTLAEHPDALTADGYQELDSVLNLDAAISTYNPNRSDEVSSTIRKNADVAPLLRCWLALGAWYPSTYATAYAELASGWTSLSLPLDYAHEVEGDLLSPVRITFWANGFFGGDEDAMRAFFSNCDFSLPSWLSGANALLENMDAWKARHLPVFSSYGLFCFAVPLVTFVYLVSRKRFRGLCALLPYYLLLGSLYVGPMVLFWYSIPFVYALPLVLGVPFSSERGNRQRRSAPAELQHHIEKR